MREERDLQNKRVDWIDSLKGIGILLVLIGHMIANRRIEDYIYSFHIPLFFWISGYLFTVDKYPRLWGFIDRRIRTLVIPYFVFAFVSFLFWVVVVRSLSVRGQVHSMNPWFPFWGIFYGIGVSPWRNPLDIALWFLPCLFVTEVIYWIIKKYFHGKLFFVLIIICGCAGYFSSIWVPVRLPWSIDVALTALVFYGIGDMSKRGVLRIFALRWRWRILIIVSLFVVGFGVSMVNGKADMNYNVYGNPVLFFWGALCGILFWVLIVMSFRPHSLLTYIGKNTIIVLGLGGVSGFVLLGLYYLVAQKLGGGAGKYGLVEAIMYSLVQVGFLMPVIYMVNRFLPFILGRKM